MDTLNDDSNNDRLIEEYLFSGYQPASYKLSSDIDQQFARPIEDEDIFGIDQNIDPAGTGFDAERYQDLGEPLVGPDSFCDDLDLDFGESNLPNVGKDLFRGNDQHADLSLLPDFIPNSPSSPKNIDFTGITTSTNIAPIKEPQKSYATSSRSRLTEDKDQVDLKSEKLKTSQRRIEQALAKGITPKKPESIGGLVELDVNLKSSELPSKGRIIYEKMVQKSIESKRGLYGGRKVTWPVYSEVLRKKISTDKRKIWDSFQKPADNFDDEEEVIMSEGEIDDKSPSGSPRSNQSSPDESSSEVCDDDADCEVDSEVDENEDAESIKFDAQKGNESSPVTPIKGPLIQEDDSDY